MSEFAIGLIGTSALLILVFAGVRVFVVAAIVGLLGCVAIIGWKAGAGISGTVPHSKSINYALSVLPMFILIGFIAYHGGLTHALFRAARNWFGWVPGGLAVASVFATAGFAAVSGASTATAAVSGGKVTGFTITSVGGSYTAPPSITVAAPSATTFNGASAVDPATDRITITSHPYNTGDKVTYNDGGGTAITGLTDGQTAFVIKVNANTVELAASADDAGAGTAIDITADGVGASHNLTGTTATGAAQLGSTGITHAGWVKRTEGSGGRSGRVFYETLVASSSITGDASDDTVAPDS